MSPAIRGTGERCHVSKHTLIRTWLSTITAVPSELSAGRQYLSNTSTAPNAGNAVSTQIFKVFSSIWLGWSWRGRISSQARRVGDSLLLPFKTHNSEKEVSDFGSSEGSQVFFHFSSSHEFSRAELSI